MVGWPLFLILLLSITASRTAQSSVPPEPRLLTAFEQVWKIKGSALSEWTRYEIDEYRRLFAGPVDFSRLEWRGTPNDPVLRVRFFDRFSPTGEGLLDIHLTARPPPPDLRFLKEGEIHRSYLCLNGVVFRPRSEHHAAREVYLGDAPSLDVLHDRLRLAVNDNEILNPWFRVRIPKLAHQVGMAHEMPSLPQEAAVQFLMQLLEQGKLSEGALVQMPTGMGKTEVILFLAESLYARMIPFRLLWLVHGKKLAEQPSERFRKLFESQHARSLVWHSDTVEGREEIREISHGGVQHLFASMDTVTSAANQNVLGRWMNLENAPPVLVIHDETHQRGAEGYERTLKWLKDNHSLLGEVGLTATALHFVKGAIAQYYKHLHFSLIESAEMDESGLPTISFFEQLLRASLKGYLPIPLPYSLNAEPWGYEKEHLYSEDEMALIANRLLPFRPFKGFLFHPGGRSEAYASTSQMNQFTDYLRSKRPLGEIPVWALSGADETADREQILADFSESSEGALNLTRLGSVGLDSPSANLTLLLETSESAVLTVQRFGRSNRLFPGKPFNRLVDWSGENMHLLFVEMSMHLPHEQISKRANELKRLIDRRKSAANSESVLNEFGEILAIDPQLVPADPRVFDKLLSSVYQTLRTSRRYRVVLSEASVFPRPSEGEVVGGYLARADVWEQIATSLQLSLQNLVKKENHQKVLAVLSENVLLPGTSNEEKQSALNSALSDAKKDLRKQLLQSGQKVEQKQSYPVGLAEESLFPSCLEGQVVSGYLSRADVWRHIATSLQLSPQELVKKENHQKVLALLTKNLLLPGTSNEETENVLNRAFKNAKTELKKQLLEKGQQLDQSKRYPVTLIEGSDFPKPRTGEVVTGYLNRADVWEHLAISLQLPLHDIVKKENNERALSLLSKNLVLLGTSDEEKDRLLKNAIQNTKGGLKKQLLETGHEVEQRKWYPATLSEGSAFPKPLEGEMVRGYLARADVWDHIATALKLSLQDLMKKQNHQRVLVLLTQNLLPGTSVEEKEHTLNEALQNAKKGLKHQLLESGQKVERSRSHFVALSDRSEFPMPAEGEVVNGYLSRTEVWKHIATSLQFPLQDLLKRENNKRVLFLLSKNLLLPGTPDDERENILYRALQHAKQGQKKQLLERGQKVEKQKTYPVALTDRSELPKPLDGELLSSYLNRTDVWECIATSLQFPLEDFTKTENHKRILFLLSQNLLVSGTSDEDKQRVLTTAFQNAKRGLKKRPPVQKPESADSPSIEAWPKSAGLHAELPRLELLHRIVSGYLVEQLRSNPKKRIVFLLRDAGDFLETTRARAEKEGVAIDGRLLPLLLSRKVVLGNPKNPRELSKVTIEELTNILQSQNIHRGLFTEGNSLTIFDIGFDGHLVRPILAALLRQTSLTPIEFHRVVSGLFLHSNPNATLSHLRGDLPLLERWDLRERFVFQTVWDKWKDLSAAYELKPEDAILKYLRSYGEMPIDEFPWAEAIRLYTGRGEGTLAEIETTLGPLLSDVAYFRDWLETYVEGKGQHLVTDSMENEFLRHDLARGHGRVASFEFVDGALRPVFDTQAHATEASVSPASEVRRRAWLCGQVLSRTHVSP